MIARAMSSGTTCSAVETVLVAIGAFGLVWGTWRLALELGHADNDPVQLVRHDDLAAQAGVRPAALDVLEQVLLLDLRRLEPILPGVVDVDVARAAGAHAAALGDDPGDVVADGAVHQGQSDRDFD